MVIGPQLTSSTSPIDGVLAKSLSMDSEAIQPSSFGEILNDEKKKLQQQQEVSALSLVAVLAAMQTSPIAKSAPSLDAGSGNEVINSEKQPALQTGSSKQITSQPISDLQLNKAGNGQAKTVPEKTVAKIQINAAMPVFDLPQPIIDALGKAESSPQSMAVSETGMVINKPTTSTANPLEISGAPSVSPASDSISPKVELDLAKIVVKMQSHAVLPATEGSALPAKDVENVDEVSNKGMIVPDTEIMNEKPGLTIDEESEVIPSMSNRVFRDFAPVSPNPNPEKIAVEVKPSTLLTSDVSSAIEKQGQATVIQTQTPVQFSTDDLSFQAGTEKISVEVKPLTGLTTDVTTAIEKPEQQTHVQPQTPVQASSVNLSIKTGNEETVIEAQPSAVLTPAITNKIETPGQSTVVQAPNQPTSDKPSVMAEPEKSAVEAKTDEMQTSVAVQVPKVPAATDTQSNVHPLGSAGENLAAKTDPKVGAGQGMVSAETSRTLNEIQVGSVNKSDGVDESALPIPLAGQKAVPAVNQVSDLVGAQSKQEDVKTNQTGLVSEKTSPVEKRLEPTPELEPIAVSTTPAVESAKVKEAGKMSIAQVSAQAADVVQQIMSKIKVNIKSGDSSIHLQLNPKDLGAIEVQMTSNAKGVNVTFLAEQASTGQLLETQINQLRQSLKDAGVQLTGLNINLQDQPKQEGGFFKQNPNFNQYSQRNAFQSEAERKERERPERIGGSTNEIDYLI